MRYLILMDDLRQDALWIGIIVLVFVSLMMIWSPRISGGWRRRTTRFVGVALFCMAAATGALAALFATLDPPRQHFSAASPDGSRFALLSHSELRDGASTEVTVAPHGCCSRFLVYRYFGDGDDYVGPTSVRWVDDHHLTVEYVQDGTGTQRCESSVADIVVTCIARADNLPALRHVNDPTP
jgi:hypothetical protein